MLIDDSVQDKRYLSFIELVKPQYSGAEYDLVRGNGVVNLAHSAGVKQDFSPIDYRVYAPNQDGKIKNDHFADMVVNAVFAKKIKAQCILFDSWYASASNLKDDLFSDYLQNKLAAPRIQAFMPV